MTLKDKLLIYVNRKLNETEFLKQNCEMNFKNSKDSLEMYEKLREEIKIECLEEIINDIFKIVFFCK